MVFKKKATKKKNVTKTFVDGKEQQDPEVPDKVPELEIPTPPPEEKVEKPLTAQQVYDEGRSVGFQEGMIYSMQLIQDHLHQHQAELKKRQEQKKGE